MNKEKVIGWGVGIILVVSVLGYVIKVERDKTEHSRKQQDFITNALKNQKDSIMMTVNDYFDERQRQYSEEIYQSNDRILESVQKIAKNNKNRPNAQTTIDYINRVNDVNRHSIAQSIIRQYDSLDARGSEIVRGYPEGKFEGN